MKKPTKPNYKVSLDELTKVTGRSTSWLNDRSHEGFFKPESYGNYDLATVIPGIVKYYERKMKEKRAEKPQDLAAEQLAFQKEKTREIKMRNAKAARELISMSECCAVVDMLVGGMNAALNGFPARFTRDPELRKFIEKEVNDLKERAKQRWADMLEKHEKGQTLIDDDDDDDDNEETTQH